MTDTNNLRFTKTHEWVRADAHIATVGISDYAQQEIRDIVYIEMPKLGKEVAQATAAAVIESVKAAFEIYAPVSGKIVSINENAVKDFSLVHKSPYADGWLFKIEMTDPKEIGSLMDAKAYDALTASAHH
ncbi:MAG: glycine cleavage system protein GcvH [Elusimicrobiota bacterium]